MPYFVRKLGKMSQTLLSTAVVIGALRAKAGEGLHQHQWQFSCHQFGVKLRLFLYSVHFNKNNCKKKRLFVLLTSHKTSYVRDYAT